MMRMNAYFNMIQDNTGETIRTIRTNSNLSQREVGEPFLGQSNIAKIEQGLTDPSYINFMKILYNLNVTLNEFMFLAGHHKQNRKDKVLNNLEQFNHLNDISLAEETIKLCDIWFADTGDLFFSDYATVLRCSLYVSQHEQIELDTTLFDQLTTIWNRILAMDEWYLNELYLISYVILLVPFDGVVDVAEEALRRLDVYDLHLAETIRQQIHGMLTIMLTMRGQYELAIEYADRYFTTSQHAMSGNVAIYTNMFRAISYLHLGQREKATKLARISISIVALLHQNEKETMLEVMKRAIISFPPEEIEQWFDDIYI
ncbi:helix-turn-helix transcriptional regulator [Erysipelothrix sp. HDW6C]|uniref:helix-turn-helix domain-containing protein n=1 Tax=Erysipelothrix sp. HDW6C TaxID=2714930 RepID=UPI00140E8A68|nr:helix-turn-helix transcriptional regulator [Erysipelothrix sp. HDW6C]QIK70620.1 helix-turn-helix transcriptional regulator [Erysipelothrix sp. HDW6C]